jgi:putative transposase
MVDKNSGKLSIRHQCELLEINRSSYYYESTTTTRDDVELMNEIREIWASHPFYGYRRIANHLKALGKIVNRKRVQRLMQIMGLSALHPKPKTSVKNNAHAVYPYLLKDLSIERPNQAWMVDITYLKLDKGFMYLVALIDVFSRYVVSWRLSNTLHTDFCLDALWSGLSNAKPEIINSDQGCQFTSDAWVEALKDAEIKISMTSTGRCLDNIYIERFWRSLKYEEIYLNDYDSVAELKRAVAEYIEFYNHKRFHQSLDYKTPAEVYFGKRGSLMDMCTNLLASSQVLHTYPHAQQQLT